MEDIIDTDPDPASRGSDCDFDLAFDENYNHEQVSPGKSRPPKMRTTKENYDVDKVINISVLENKHKTDLESSPEMSLLFFY